jgi:hypothetical protein
MKRMLPRSISASAFAHRSLPVLATIVRAGVLTKARRHVLLLPIAIFAAGTIAALASTVAAAPDRSRHGQEHATLFAMGQGGEVLLAIDVENGRTTVIGPTGFPRNCCPPLAITPDGNAAYTIANSADPVLAQLAKIDLRTGAATLVGKPLGQDLFIMGMTFSPDGVLYAAGDVRASSPTFNSLYTINQRTGAATRVGPFGVSSPSCDPGPLCFSRFIMSFSFDTGGTMYGATPSAPYTINPRTGAATKVVEFVGSSAVMGISFAEDGTLFAADFVDLPPGSTIYTVNLKTGFLTPLFKTGIALIHNIAFMPEPACCETRGHQRSSRWGRS